MPEKPFRKISCLGIGGFGEAWLVEVLDKKLKNKFEVSRCVIKIPVKAKEKSIKEEVFMAAALQHNLIGSKANNVVRYLGFTFWDGKFVMAMEYVPDGNLRDKIGDIGSQRRLPLADAIGITEQLLEALVLIHDQHIIHRDIKPENILFDGNVVKLCDLGIATLLSPDELTYSVSGTLPYMAPEILDQKGGSFASDVWSVGVCLYEMLTGQLPFWAFGISRSQLEKLICSGNYIKAHKICPDIPESVSNLISKSLEKEVSRRFNHAGEMLEALRKAYEDPVKKDIAQIQEQMKKHGQTDVVEARLKKLIMLFPDDGRLYRLLGELYNRGQRYSEAIAILKKGIKADPQYALLYWHLFLSYEGIGDPQKAEEALKKAKETGLDASLRRSGEYLLKGTQKREA